MADLRKLLEEIRDDLYDLDGEPRLMQREDTESVICELDRAVALASPREEQDGAPVLLRDVDADALLAAAEAAINAGLSFGPGLHARNVEEAARRIESACEMRRMGFR